MQRLEVSGAVRPMYGSLSVKRLIKYVAETCLCRPLYASQCLVMFKNHSDSPAISASGIRSKCSRPRLVGVEVLFHLFLSWVLDGDEGSASSPGRFTHGKINPRHPLNRTLGWLQRRAKQVLEKR